MMSSARKRAPRSGQIKIKTGTASRAQSLAWSLTSPILLPARIAVRPFKTIHRSNKLITESRNVLSYLIKPLTDSVSRTFRE
jgi:hypothetical protein